jgi:UPF0042 nucleotide-binding protein
MPPKREPRASNQFVIVTGLSGAGKSQAIKCFEDLGFFCVDNLPPALIPKFAELCSHSDGQVRRVALVVDVRSGELFDDLQASLHELRDMGVGYQVLFLDAAQEALVNRFKTTRRPHPLGDRHRTIIESIEAERRRLADVKERADKVIDTTDLAVRDLKEEIAGLFVRGAAAPKILVSVVSFGYKFGVPVDADLVFDVRFLANPHYVPEFQHRTGADQQVVDFIMADPSSERFLRRLFTFVDSCLPLYVKEGKSYLTIAIGCTGGRHRSVTISDMLAAHLRERGYEVIVDHRDVKRG